MSAGGGRGSELRSLMAEALRLSAQLQDYTDVNSDVFLSDDDDKILEVLENREKYIESLADLEVRIDTVVDNEDGHDPCAVPLSDVQDLRRSVRSVLADVAAKDMKVMKLISSRMQIYRDETLKARSKQNLTAYMRSGSYSKDAGFSIDISK